MQFSSLFSALIELTNVSHKTLSERTEYHNSYISKWANGSRLPTSKGISELLSKVADCFADAIEEEHLYNGLQDLSMRPVLLSDWDTVYSAVYSLLEDSYVFSRQMQEANSTKTDALKQTFAIYGHEKVTRFTLDLLNNLVQSTKEDVEVWMSFDPTLLSMPESIASYDMTITRDVQVDVKVMVNCGAFADRPEPYFQTLLNLLLRTAPYEMQMFDCDPQQEINCILCLDRFACFYLTDEVGQVMVMYYTNEPEIVDFYKQMIAPIFSEEKRVTQPLSIVEYREVLHEVAEGKRAELIFGTTCVNGFFLTEEILDLAVARDEISTEAKDDILQLLSLIDSIHENNDILYMLPESFIRDFARLGEVQFGMHRFFLNKQERALFLNRFSEIITKYPNSRALLLHDHMTPFGRKNTQYSIFKMDDKVYLKKDLAVAKNGSSAYYAILSPEIAERISKVLLDLSQMSDTNYSPEELAEYLVSMAR